MSRTLKFRIWDKLEKRFTYPEKPTYKYHHVLYLDGSYENLQNGAGGKEVVVQQYTGATDLNGKEIFEGDILKNIKGDIFEVKFEEETDETESSGYFFSTFGVEIVGNIFENKELLEK